MSDLVPFNKLLRRAMNMSGRVSKGRHLAELLGVTEGYVSHLLRDEDPKLPSLEVLLKLCDILGTHPNALLGFIDPDKAMWQRRYMRYYSLAVQTKDLVLNDALVDDSEDRRRLAAMVAGNGATMDECPTQP